MLATITGNSRLVVEPEEAQRLATALQRVARHYDVPGMKQETLDWIGLIQTAGAIYGSRIMAARFERMSEPNPKAGMKAEAKVEPIKPGPSAPTPPAARPVPAHIPGLGDVEILQ